MRELAQLPQFLVGEIHFFFISGAFEMTQSGIFREAAQFGSGYAEQEGGSSLGHKLWNIIRQIVHDSPNPHGCAGVIPDRRLLVLLNFNAARTFLPPALERELVRLRA